MEDAEVTPRGAQPSEAADKAQGGSGKDEKVTLTRAEFESMRRETAEARESERYWAGVARGGSTAAAETAEEPEEEIETSDLVPVTGDPDVDEAIFNDPDKWAEAISKGPAAIKAFVQSLGLVTGAQVADIAAKVAQRTVQVERQKITSDNVIVREFPELTNPNSEFFKATGAELRKLVALDPRAKNSPATLYAAASTAKAKLDAKQPARRRAADDDDDRYDRADTGRESEEERRHRADAQDGTRTRGRGTDEEADMLGPEAKEVIRQMGISPDEFAASAKETRSMRPRGRR